MKPRWYQDESVAAVWQHLCTQQGSPVVVLPTGAGKSLVIAMLCRDAVQRFNGRVIVLAHRKELLQQNAEKIRALLPDMDVGIYSAGLNSRDTDHDIVLAGIQSVYERAGEFGSRQIVIIDEVHLCNSDGEGMYKTFLGKMREINPKLRMVGLTATPFRTGEGKLCRPDALFQSVCYEASIKRLINEGYLSNLITATADNTVDTSGLHIRAGEFVVNEMVALFDDEAKIKLACQELVTKTQGRKSTLIFCSGVHHAESVAETIQQLTGEECGIVVGDTPPIERASMLARFRSGELKRLCNCDVLTTGFDAPGIDAIAVLRATASPGLFAQICGRGLRTAEGKQDCMILDFGSNVKRHGPLDDPDYGKQSKGGSKGNGDAPTKTCPNCEEELHLSATECDCGFQFPRQLARHETQAGSDQVLSGNEPIVEWVVDEFAMARHKKKGGTPDDPDTLRIDYICHEPGTDGNLARQRVSEWVCLEHDGYAGRKAQDWWLKRCLVSANGIDDAIELWERGAVATPTAIRTKKDGKWLRVVGYDLDPIPERDEWRDVGESVVDVNDEWAMDDVPF
jgi:DNA repair protein RadD